MERKSGGDGDIPPLFCDMGNACGKSALRFGFAAVQGNVRHTFVFDLPGAISA